MKGPFKNKQGSTLLEIIVAIAILGLMVAPVCSSLVLSHRLNADSEKTLQARLLVESTVEQLMAEGVRYELGEVKTDRGEDIYVLVTGDLLPGVTVKPHQSLDSDIVGRIWYEITVESGDVTVKTIVKAAPTPVETPEDAQPPAKESEGDE